MWLLVLQDMETDFQKCRDVPDICRSDLAHFDGFRGLALHFSIFIWILLQKNWESASCYKFVLWYLRDSFDNYYVFWLERSTVSSQSFLECGLKTCSDEIMHQSMVCPRRGGGGGYRAYPRDLTATCFPWVRNLTITWTWGLGIWEV